MWATGLAMERVVREAPSGAMLLRDLARSKAGCQAPVSGHAILNTSIFVATEQ
jgi:hypothetical protein